MKPADDYADLGHRDPRLRVLACWEAYSSAHKVDLGSSALGVENQLFFFDPISLNDSRSGEITARATPAAIVLTNGNHARAAAEYRHRFDIPIYAHADARELLTLDGIEPDGELLHGGNAGLSAFEVVPLEGAVPGEVAVLYPGTEGGEGILVVGDALINLPPQGLALLPDKYCTDPPALRRSLAQLLDYSFEQVLFAHGQPIISGAHRQLKLLLAQ